MTVKQALIDYGKLARDDPRGAMQIAGIFLFWAPFFLLVRGALALEGLE